MITYIVTTYSYLFSKNVQSLYSLYNYTHSILVVARYDLNPSQIDPSLTKSFLYLFLISTLFVSYGLIPRALSSFELVHVCFGKIKLEN